MNLPTDNILITIANTEATKIIESILNKYFKVKASINPLELAYLNQHIIQLDQLITLDQADHISKICSQYFSRYASTKCDISFHTDNKVEDEFTIAVPCSPNELTKLYQQYGIEFQLICGNLQHVQVQFYLDNTYAIY